MSLQQEYLGLLRMHGLATRSDDRPIGQRLADLKRLAALLRDPAHQRRTQEVLNTIRALDQQTKGSVSAHLRKIEDRTQCRELNDYYRVVAQAMQLRGMPVPKNVFFGVFPTGEFNAVAYPSRTGYLCLLNTGLLRLLENVARAACYPIRTSGDAILYDERGESWNGLATLDVALATTVRVIVTYLRRCSHEYPLPTGFRPTDWVGIHAAALARAMKIFVLAHEMGHIALKHPTGHHVRPIIVPRGTLKVVSPSHKNEFDADTWAQELLAATDSAEQVSFPVAVGGLGFLTVHLMVQQVASNISGEAVAPDQPTESHPPTEIRIARLKKAIEETFPKEQGQRVFWLWAILLRISELLRQCHFQAAEDQIIIEVGRGSGARTLQVSGRYSSASQLVV